MAQDSESFASLLSSALNDVRELFRQEISLARFEVREELTRAITSVVALAAGGIVLLLGIALILNGAARGVASLVHWPLWAGFFLVGAVVSIAGIVSLLVGSSRIRTVRVVPPQTAETLKEDVEWLKRQTRSVRE